MILDFNPDFNVDKLEPLYDLLLSSIPVEGCDIIKTYYPLFYMTIQFIQLILLLRSFVLLTSVYRPPTSYDYWEKLGYNLDWQKVWKCVFIRFKNPDFTNLDFKLVHM
ncbi:hypothetical protein SNE40_020589 [Patella caerulea]|uniref:Uncharacterized protein n=1 Tax=Patella caerulea TaxID=87958 RepID=A0AAN8PB35_PATCE